MNRKWTVDTYVLYQAAHLNFNAIKFLIFIDDEEDIIVLDHDKYIDTEYTNCIEKLKSEYFWGRTFVSEWFIRIVKKSAFRRYCGDLDKRHKNALKELNFHNDDWPFVAVCSCTTNKNLVSEESDYDNEVKEYLQEKMEVHVLSIQDSLNLYKQ